MKALFVLTISFLFAVSSYAQTFVTGGIYTDATWSKSGSPYIVKDSVVIFDNATLTIDAGVTVIFYPGATMRLRGNLSAIGTKSDSIRFTGSIKEMGSWEGIYATSKDLTANAHQITMDYCIGEYATRFVDLLYAERGPYTFTHCSFYKNTEINRHNNTVPVTGLIFDSCYFERNQNTVYGMGGSNDAHITNCVFLNNAQGPVGGVIDNCISIGNTNFGAYLYTSITNSYFYNNNVGISADMHSKTFLTNCEIHHNNIGIAIERFWQDPNIVLQHNKICNNDSFNIRYDYYNNADISKNCFCLNDSQSIRSTIRDGYASINYGLLTYASFDTCSLTSSQSCDTPENIHIAPIGADSIQISWDAVPTALEYEYSFIPSSAFPYHGDVCNTNSIKLANPAGAPQFYIGVRSRCSILSYSSWATKADSFSTTSISFTNPIENRVLVYPNPAEKYVTVITENSSKDATIEISDIIGKHLFTQSINHSKTTVDIQSWPAGTYILQYRDGANNRVTKFTKQ